ncbi:MAG: Unknown protein [uncultured Sulfurovum sp.]|uniref:Outer membrane porin, OprD family n=1 Tax=uncultured Sulfurovum sp. TaxID=269237 RepID=A0A6S6SPZ7_9BACT|nr:MAG: Unknown protein [uncultured Sulfurovum sp.]
MTLFIVLEAEDGLCKHGLKCNMIHFHKESPEDVSSLEEMFSEGMFYGRLRFNSFGFKWENEIDNRRKNHAIAGMGTSFHYRSAYLNGFGFGVGVYTTQALGSLEATDVHIYKAGKDLLSRYNALHQNKNTLNTIAQGYLEYTFDDHTLKAGRQTFESYLTASNDTKMIPNSFEGLTYYSKSLYGTSLKLGYLTKQKLRDHTDFHHVLAYGDDSLDAYARYSENDDAAMHRGLTSSKLEDLGIRDKLMIVEMKNNSFRNLSLLLNYTSVPDLVSSGMLEAHYRLDIENWTIVPGVRYMKQLDNGAGKIGGANIKTLTTGYTNPDSVDTQMYGLRVDVIQDNFKLRFGHTQVEDRGDIIAPWRGFPTTGFTRAMGQYNWYANTKSYMVQLDYEFEHIPNFKVLSRFVLQDFDNHKEGVPSDSSVFTLDFAKTFLDKSLYVKTRYAHVVGNTMVTPSGFEKLNPSYDELRMEINYLF